MTRVGTRSSNRITLLDEWPGPWNDAKRKRRITLEYTDAPTSEPAVAADTISCPLCGQVLSKDADSCDRCDWVRAPDTDTAEGKASDLVAVMLSVVPGLGHVYKGYKLLGLLFVIGAFGAILSSTP